jgi:hypothetical protein
MAIRNTVCITLVGDRNRTQTGGEPVDLQIWTMAIEAYRFIDCVNVDEHLNQPKNQNVHMQQKAADELVGRNTSRSTFAIRFRDYRKRNQA